MNMSRGLLFDATLDLLQGVGLLRMTRKASLLAAVKQLPRNLSAIVEGSVLPGYVASVTPDAIFVRFLDRVTGRAGLHIRQDAVVLVMKASCS